MSIDSNTLTPARLCPSQYMPASVSPIIINPGGKATIVTGIWMTNSGTVSRAVTIHRVPASGGSVGTASNGNKLASFSIPANGSKLLEFKSPGVVLESLNDSIQAVASAATEVSVSADGFIADVI